MLSLAKMNGQAWAYYASEVAQSVEDYYFGRGEEPGRWSGAQAEAWGLAGATVTDEALRRLFGGLDPVSGDTLGRAFGAGSVNGISATFSAPKSVSLLWALADEATAGQVRDAHRAAVADGLAYLEKCASLTRLGAGGRYQVDARGLAIAIFEHRTSRVGDPQLHSHALIATKVRALDGEWRSLDTNEIYAHAKTAGTVYQAALRAELTRRLGVSWEVPSPHGQADLLGLEQSLLEHFSRRRLAIVGAVEAWRSERIAEGRLPEDYEPTRADYELATLSTRPTKDRATTPESLRQRWQDDAAELGWTPDRVRDGVLHKSPAIRGVEADELTDEVLSSLVAKRATFAERDVVRSVAARIDGDLETVAAAAAIVMSDRRVVSLAAPDDPSIPAELCRRDGRPQWLHQRYDRWTTTDQLALEASVLDRIEAAPAFAAPPPDAVESAFLSRPLAIDQQAAVAQLLTSSRPVDVLVAAAGAGKSHTLAAAAEGWRQGGNRVVAMAPRGVAAAVMREEGLANADTVAKYLCEWSRPVVDPAYRLGRGDVVVVDEAGSLSTRDLALLTSATMEAAAKLVLVGDDRQLSSVEAGGLFAHLAASEDAACLVAVRRQRADWEKEASQGLRERDPEALHRYDDQGRLHGGDRMQMVNAAFQGWLADRVGGVDSVMLAARRADARELNEMARAALIEAGQVAKRGRRWGTQMIGKGDLVLTTSPDRRRVASNGQWVRNGDRWRVLGVGRAGELSVEHGEHHGRLVLDQSYGVENVLLGYAMTIHKSQAATVERAHLVADGRLSAEHLYVGMTRGRDANHVYVVNVPDDELEGEHVRPEERSAIDVLSTVLTRSEANVAAHAVLQQRLDESENLARLGAQLDAVDARIARDAGPDRSAELKDLEAVRREVLRMLAEARDHLRDVASKQRRRQSSDERRLAEQAAASWTDRLADVEARLEPVTRAQDTRDDWLAANPEVSSYRQELAERISTRQTQLGEWAAATRPGWLVQRLGNIPSDEKTREAWVRAAGRLASYRERWDVAPPDLGGDRPRGQRAVEWRECERAIAVVEDHRIHDRRITRGRDRVLPQPPGAALDRGLRPPRAGG